MRSAVIVLVCMLLMSCGTKFAYRNVDWFILEYLDDFVDLTGDQDDILTLQIQQLKDWHKKEELPLYEAHIDSLLLISPDTLTPDAIAQHFKKMEQHSERLLTRVAPDLYSLIQTLTDEQVKQLLENLSKRHEEYRNKYQDLSEQEIHARYQERIGDRVETWLGRLNNEQQKIVDRWSKDLRISAYEWMAYQTRMRGEWRRLLDKRDELSYFQPNFHRLLFESDQYFSPELKDMIEYNRSVSQRYIVELFKTMSDKQLKRFRSELVEWKEIVADLQTP
ncbi:DUF6279 family lipoprotein [Vibrio genomosp. F10]|uniref:Lipoprotein n=1 Tax=Vibrio genomosp. F10 TaxID=723171 RepID=A0A1B9QW82_9VIBR|nr:DUF6279 family lipoprotein [Vibrio genomosp. F10]OCH73772.1 hypothetical protein A6E14_13970 [Vibrio genomosp. F10]